jgi:hypothetical protein
MIRYLVAASLTQRFGALCLISLVFATPAAAKNFPVVGGQGEHSIVVGCTRGEYIIGFTVRIGSWIDRIGPVCAPLLPSMAVGEKRVPATYGGNGGEPSSMTCETDEVLQGIAADRLASQPNTLQSVKLLCGSTSGNYQFWHGEPGEGGGFSASWSRDASYAFVLSQVCPKGEWAWGIAIRYGQYVNALGLMCRKPDLPTAAATPAPPAGPPPTPVLESAPPPVAGSTWKRFVGVWDTTVQPDKKIELTMSQQGSLVQGRYTGDGSINGRAVGNELTFNWAQPGGSGTGKFFISDDETSFSGSFSTAQDPGRFYAWGGRKVK